MNATRPPAVSDWWPCLLIAYHWKLLDLTSNLFPFQRKDHIRGALEEAYVTPPACTAFAMEQTYELLLHLAPTVRADTLIGSHGLLLKFSNNFFGSHTTCKQLL